jgi:hypothetical protein
MVTRIRELADRVRDWFSRSQDRDWGLDLCPPPRRLGELDRSAHRRVQIR